MESKYVSPLNLLSHPARYKVTRVSLWNFMEWLETVLNEKYDLSLQGLKLRFQHFYNIIKAILKYTIELNDLVRN